VRVIWVGIIGAATLLLGTIYTFQMSCLNRDLRFRAESFQNLIFAAALATTGLSLALVARRHRSFGVFAVALQPFVAQFIGNVVIYHRHPFHWPRAFQFAMAKKMLNYGWKVTVAQYANNLLQSVTNAFIAVVGGPAGLGVYGRATQVSDMIGYNLLSSFDRVLHPLLRSVRDDEQRLRSLFMRGCIASMLMCIFGWAWLAGTAPDLIRVVIGPQWSGVPPLLRIVSLSLLVAGPGAIGIVVVNALGRPLVWFKFGVISVSILLAVGGMSLKIHRSMEAIAGAFVLSQFVLYISLWVWAIGTQGAESRKLVGHAIRLLFVGAATVGCIFFAKHFFTMPLLRLIAGSGAGGAAFIGLVLLVDREAILVFRTLIQRRDPVASPVPLSIGPDGRPMPGLAVPGDDSPSRA
jgi:PST family polysaccharide transporter